MRIVLPCACHRPDYRESPARFAKLRAWFLIQASSAIISLMGSTCAPTGAITPAAAQLQHRSHHGRARRAWRRTAHFAERRDDHGLEMLDPTGAEPTSTTAAKPVLTATAARPGPRRLGTSGSA
jgi:hypothetical protein